MMSYSFFLCVVLLVSQVDMLPVEPMTGLSGGSETGPSKLTTLLRTKRTVIGSGHNSGCSEGMLKLWKGGPCVTCEEYMEHKDTDDCPNNG